MQHTINLVQLTETYGAQAPAMLTAIESCVHCGFCLPTCPSYQVLGEEMDSPRGRIVLMKTALENGLSIQDTKPYIDRCLGCMACVTSCPSGVKYGELMFPYRAHTRQVSADSASRLVARKLATSTLPYPQRFRCAARLGRTARPFKKLLPNALESMLDMLPDEIPSPFLLPKRTLAQGERRGRVALLAGCVQQVLAPEINRLTLEVLSHNGVEVIIPAGQACCGAVLNHSGDAEGARKMARQNLQAFQGVLTDEFDILLTNAAGCGSGIKEYPHLFRGLPEEEKAIALAEKTQDVSVYLVNLGLLPPPPLPRPLKVAYQDACHLAHAQGVTEPPRRLLANIANLTLLPVAQSELCCGSAGTYNIEQPEIAFELGRRKAENILHTGCDLVVTGNIGCLIQLRKHLAALGEPRPVVHTIELLALAYQIIS